MNIIEKINDYNKKKTIEIRNILDLQINYTISFKENNLLTLLDEKKKILTSEYFFFGIYQPTTKLWIWASSIPGVNKLQIDKIESIRNKSYLFENSDNLNISFIYQLLTQDVIQINNKEYLIFINNILNFLNDGLHIFNPYNTYGNMQFIGMTNIIEKYI